MNITCLKIFQIFCTIRFLQSFFLVVLRHLRQSSKDPDPLESVNRSIFAFNEKADKYALKPVAEGYKAVAPEPC